ncbi:hypothetical protein JHN63_06640 [Streptomyces sp. MBT65]|uniref:hypothetical protein n=1 Tax=Streptomyces sp. MBT65 TaxID=1488395 RepID=UPI0019096C7F|nr:hypothetical protein [Streptomyces sp. MBT65]MBK3573502.1 hypothetical protein [Streptomyces sp. MBT65]
MTTTRAEAAPVTVDRAAIEHRLITMRKSVVQLDSLGRLDGARLENDPGTGLALERVLALLHDLALAINRHVSAGVLGEAPPQTPTTSFGAAARAGLIDAELAAALAPADGPHHVLLQLCLDAEPEQVAGVVSAARNGYRDYVRQVTDWITASTPGPVV